MSNEFSKALADFTHDFASGGAIRHLADLGYNAYEIKEKLEFPTPVSKIAATMWTHFVNTGKVRLTPPETDGEPVITKDYITVYDSYGKPSFKQVTKTAEAEERKYVKVDFGYVRYKDPKGFEAFLNRLDKKERDFVEPLPWPLKEVYFEDCELMQKILRLEYVE
ncbi:MAG: hypothetical protein IKZ94_06085 [Lachnospiraceae bacterium]|nr:hypothetical protein [Lachnospiraceae bacterium]